MMGGRGWRHQLAALFQFDRLYRRSNCSKYQLSIEKFPFGIASSDAEIEVEQSNRKGGFGTALRYASLRNLGAKVGINPAHRERSEEHTSELQSLMRISYAVFCLKKKIHTYTTRP